MQKNKAASKIHVCTEDGHDARLPGEILALNLNCQELVYCSLSVPFSVVSCSCLMMHAFSFLIDLSRDIIDGLFLKFSFCILSVSSKLLVWSLVFHVRYFP